MKQLLDNIENIKFTTDPNFSYNLDKEFNLISDCLDSKEKEYLKTDFKRFFEKGRHLVMNTFVGGILFLKVTEPIKKITIKSIEDSNSIIASVIFSSEYRRAENTKYKPNATQVESIDWNVGIIFPNFYKYHQIIQNALLLIIIKIVKRICEYGRTKFPYLKIENEFNIELYMEEELKCFMKVELV